RSRPDRGARGPGRRRSLARRAASAVAGLALHRRDHRGAHRQKERCDLDRNAALYLLAAARSGAPSRRQPVALEHRNNLHWQLDVTFREDHCRTRKGHAAINLAMMRHAALNHLKREPTKIPIKRKRLKAAIDPDFRTTLLAC